MKKMLALICLLTLFAVYCGAPEDKTEVVTEGPGDSKEYAYQALTEIEIQKFMKAYPVAKVEIDKAGKRLDAGEDATDILGAFGHIAQLNTEIAGLDAKMKAAGMSWQDFSKAMAKIMMAAGAMAMAEQKGELDKAKAELNDPNIPEAQREMMKAMLKGLDEAMKMYEKVPQQNIDLVKKHWDELDELFD
jgi:acyl-CoA reductase-like NAD-dependent aldehyde dehydrogenase